MNKKMISDDSILFDLEFKGIDSFLSDIRDGFFVPRCFVDRIKRIVYKNYELELIIDDSKTLKKQNGTFCLMEYNDELVILKGKQ